MADFIRQAWQQKQASRDDQQLITAAYRKMGLRAYAEMVGRIVDKWREEQGDKLDSIPPLQRLEEIRVLIVRHLKAQQKNR